MKRGVNTYNQYANLFDKYDKTPKAVYAAVLASYMMLVHEVELEGDFDGYLKQEWGILHGNGIVPQKPRI